MKVRGRREDGAVAEAANAVGPNLGGKKKLRRKKRDLLFQLLDTSHPFHALILVIVSYGDQVQYVDSCGLCCRAI